MAGIFAAMLLVISIFTASQFVGRPYNPPLAEKPKQIEIPDNVVVGTVAPSAGVPTTAVQTSGVSGPTEAATISPRPNPSPGTPTMVPTLTATSVPQGIDVTARVEVPLLGQVVETVTSVVQTVTDPLTDTVNDLLGN
jgi:hypothetical protein